MRRLISRFRDDERGVTAVTFALAAIPLLGVMGIAVDYARAYRVQSHLQTVVDAAALAGATEASDEPVPKTVRNYLRSQLPRWIDGARVKHSLEMNAATITVSAQGAVPTTLAAIFEPEMPVSATAVAQRGKPVRIVKMDVTHFNADAWDANTIYWYVVPKDGGVPKDEDMHLFLSNDPKNPAPEVPETIKIGVDDELAFALMNVTGGVKPYGKNQYGQPQGSVHKFYSHLEPENVRSSGKSDCTRGTVEHAWDDNGGAKDDNDYNDAVYEFSCKVVETEPTTVYLIR
jgi:Flp pilus assembly protein TadG